MLSGTKISCSRDFGKCLPDKIHLSLIILIKIKACLMFLIPHLTTVIPLCNECNTTFHVTITDLTFSQNRAHNLVIQRRLYIFRAEIFFNVFKNISQKNKHRLYTLCKFVFFSSERERDSLSLQPAEICIFYFSLQRIQKTCKLLTLY